MLTIGESLPATITKIVPHGVYFSTSAGDSILVLLTEISDVRGEAGKIVERLRVGDCLQVLVVRYAEHNEYVGSLKANFKTNEIDLEFGFEVQDDTKLSFFGLDEVNAAIQRGGVVKFIEAGHAIMTRVVDSNGSVKLEASGGCFRTRIETKPSTRDPF